MNESSNSTTPANPQQQAELELLHSVLSQPSAHPWNPYDPQTAEYVDQLEQGVDADWDDAVVSQWPQVSQLATALWAESSVTALATALMQKFGARMPAQLLQQIAHQAQAVAGNGQALIDQLVVSTQTILTDWAVDDLQVMARPLALAMRSGQEESVDAMVQSLSASEWQDLSDVEQARLSLAIARYALAELDRQG
ncbi:MAG: hypothetical protein ACFBSG_06375 [Leptolyngbyaceae cyanobacterium]